MEYSIDKMHMEKHGLRREGKTVDAVVDIIGKIMVTENETFPFVIKYMNRTNHIRKEFVSLCINHFKVTPIKDTIWTLEIKGYSSRAIFIPIEKWERDYYTYNPNILPTFDLD
jgi:hypothetical protein